jgi:hypothetical protein
MFPGKHHRISLPILSLFLLIIFLKHPAAFTIAEDKTVRLPGEGCLAEHCSPDELNLARKLGLNLKLSGGSFRYRSIGEQTWLSPWVVEGTVRQIDEDLYGAYHTKVRVHVERYLKGTGPAEITLSLSSGRTYSEYSKSIVLEDVVGEVKFEADKSGEMGARFILFLNKQRLSAPGREEHFKRYALEESEFHPANRYRISNGKGEADSEMVRAGAHAAWSYEEMVSEILRVGRAQTQ